LTSVEFRLIKACSSTPLFGFASIVFDSTASPPEYLDGAGIAATNTAADAELAFFAGEIATFVVPYGPGLYTSIGTFVATPEPGTWALLGAGVGLLVLVSVRVSEKVRPAHGWCLGFWEAVRSGQLPSARPSIPNPAHVSNENHHATSMEQINLKSC
jgi:hypothetical protein